MNTRTVGSPRRLVWQPQQPVAAAGLSPAGWADVPVAAQMVERVGAGDGGSWLVRGGPGTGKSSLLTTGVAAAVAGGVPAQRVLVVGSSARSVAQLRRFTETARLTFPEAASGGMEPQFRTVHAVAFGLVTAAAAAAGVAPPRLLTGAEHDAIFRQALLGYAEDGGAAWPEQVRPALVTRGFARELRDVVLRTTERSVAPDELARLGADFGRPLWTAAADFARRHEQEMELRTAGLPAAEGFPTSLNAAQLVARAIEELDARPELLAGPGRIEALVVDDAQSVDPLAGELLARLAEQARLVLVSHDSDTSVFRFRGASEKFTEWVESRGAEAVELARPRREPATLAAALALARRLPGHEAWRDAAGVGAADATGATPGTDPGEAADSSALGTHSFAPVSRHVAPSPAQEATAIADFLLRQHLVHEVPWNKMAVVLRTVGPAAELLQRTFDSAGVPVVDAGAEVPPVDDPLVRALLDVADSVLREPDEVGVRQLLLGPLGKADPADLRDLRRHLRKTAPGELPKRSMAAVRELLLSDADPAELLGEDVSGRLLTPVQRIRELRAVVAGSLSRGETVEMVLWDLWHATRRAHSLREVVAEGGVDGRAADRSADAVMDLFDHAADYVEQIPRGSLAQFVDMLRQEELPAPRRAGRRPSRDAVELLSAHNTVAAEYDVVVVAGVQEGTWPAPRRRFGLFELELLVDLLDNPRFRELSQQEREAAAAAAATADERRLMVLALSRARRNVLVTAVDTPEGDLAASTFLDELRSAGIPEWATDSASGLAGHRLFRPESLVADARAVLQRQPDSTAADAAARVVSTLRNAGLPAADPGSWYRARPVSSAATPFPEPAAGPRARLSPSGLEALETCPLRWFVERQIGSSTAEPLVRGTVVHLVAQAVEAGLSSTSINAALRDYWPLLSTDKGWPLQKALAELEEMEAIIRDWTVRNRAAYQTAGVEQSFQMDLYPPPGGTADGVPAVSVRVRGRIDRLDTDTTGAFRAVDFKTSAKAVTFDKARSNPQLALYQLAIRLGAIGPVAERTPPRHVVPAEGAPDPDLVNESAGGVLVYVAPGALSRGQAAERPQPALDSESQREYMDRAVAAGARSLGPVYLAVTNDGCGNCSAAGMCPTQTTGEQVGR